MIVIGLTGGLACGKSTVTAELARRGHVIIDFDILARRLVEPGTPGLAALVESFGPEILTNNGELNRQKLGRLVFASPNDRAILNRILGPLIDAEMEAELALNQRDGVPLVILDTALLFESGLDARCDATIVVDSNEYEQIKRLMARDGFTEEQARQRIAAQMDPQVRRNKATWIMDNSGPFYPLDTVIDPVWQEVIQRFNHTESVK